MKSDPQLRQDINKLQAENRELRERVKELESRPVKVVDKPVEKVVEKKVYVDRPKVVYRDRQIPGPERVITKKVEVPGPVQYVDNPAIIRQIEKLRGMLNAR